MRQDARQHLGDRARAQADYDAGGNRRPDLGGAEGHRRVRPLPGARALGGLGNPYDAVGADDAGRAAIDWGVYGVPETFLIGKDGMILHKHVGPLTAETVRSELMPKIEEALAAAIPAS